MIEHKCNICDKFYTSASSLWTHNKKYHNTEENKHTPVNKKGNIQCQYCSKQFGNYSNRGKHHKICKLNPVNTKQDIKQDNQKSDIAIELIKNLIPEIIKSLNISQENISKVQPQIVGNENNNNNIVSRDQINSNVTGNNIIISLGNENLSDVISKNDQIKILKQKNDALLEIIKLVHFGPKYPQFHNIAIQGEKAYQYNDNEDKFLETPKEDMLFDLIENRVNDIYGFNEENKLSLSKKTYSWIKCYTNMFEFETRIKNSIKKIEPIIEQESNKLINSKQIKLEELE